MRLLRKSKAMLYAVWAMTVVLLLVFALPAGAVEPAAGNGASPAGAQQGTAAAVTEPGGIRPVSPGEFVAKVNGFVADLNTAVSGLVLPLATLAILISIVVITMGFLVGHSNLKRYGWGGLFLACVGVFLYYGVPLIIGLVRALAYRLSG